MRVPGEVVLIYYEDKPAAFARIESIELDIKRDWYQITLLMLTIPTQTFTWILRESYIDGEPFTMGGKAMRLETVERISSEKKPEPASQLEARKNQEKPGRVLPFKKP